MEDVISIIVPVYNVQCYLRRCLESIINQTYFHLQILLVEDGSTDQSRKICEEYEKKDARVRLILQKNSGVSSARNRGIQMAVGKYGMFVDADDTIESDAVKTAYETIVKKRADLVVFGYHRVDENGQKLPDKKMKERYRIIKTEEDRLSFLFCEYLSFQMAYSVCNKIYNLEYIKRDKIFFEEGVKIGEDMGFNMKYLLCAERIYSLAACLYCYHEREDSSSALDRKDTLYLRDYTAFLYGVYTQIVYKNNRVLQENFYLLFSKAMDNQYKKVMRKNRRETLFEVEERTFYTKQCKAVIRHPVKMMKYWGKREGLRQWKNFLLDKIWMDKKDET